MFKNTIFFIVIAAVQSCAWISGLCWADELDRIVAIVNEDIVTQRELGQTTADLYARFEKSGEVDLQQIDEEAFKKQVLDRLIYEKLQLQQAQLLGLIIDKAELDEAIASSGAKGKPAIQEQIKNDLMIGKLQQKEINDNIKVSDAEIDMFLKSAALQDDRSIQYHLKSLLIEGSGVEVKQKAAEISKALQRGADFSKLAIEYSNADNALSGGDLGFRTLDEVPTVFAKKVPNMHINQVLGPIRSPSGLHFVKLMAKREQADFKINRQRAMQIIYQRKSDELLRIWLRRLRDAAYVKIFL